MLRLKRGLLIFLLLVFCLGCDQITKVAAQQYLAFESPQSWFHDTVRLESYGDYLSAAVEAAHPLPIHQWNRIRLTEPGFHS